jgi:XTP/dITP diphosphohydrolase
MKLLLGTRNKGKLTEIRKALADLPLILVEPEDAGVSDDPEEHGTTFEENAILKARFYSDVSGLPTLSDDSGIIVDALKGELGVKTRRWGAGPHATDQEWVEHFLKRLENEENRKARFVSVVAFVDETDEEHIFTGICEGTITATLDGEYLPGLPLRSCFLPEGSDRVLSRMTFEEELSVNHRYKAMELLKRHLSQSIQ